MPLTKERYFAIALWVAVPIIGIFFYYFGVIQNLSSLIEQVLAGLFIAMILGGVALWWKGKKTATDMSVIVSNFDPKLRHIEARLFYPSLPKWKRFLHFNERKERNPKKKNPRHKLILVKDLKKAYYVGAYGWNLIVKDKIEWFSENEQDLEEWCKKEGYTLIPNEATEDSLLEPYFKAEIRDKKKEYHRGEPVLFRTLYRGDLVNGFFDNEIVSPDGTTIAWVWAPDTLKSGDPNVGGELNGYGTYTSNWNWNIPRNAPVGKYRVFMRVYNHLGFGNRPIIRQAEDTFMVAKRKQERRG